MPANQFQIGNGYIGSPNLQTSTAAQQVIPSAPSNWTNGYSCIKFSFMNPNQSCHVSINGGSYIYLAAGQGVSTDEICQPITSFVIQESGINFNFFASY